MHLTIACCKSAGQYMATNQKQDAKRCPNQAT